MKNGNDRPEPGMCRPGGSWIVKEDGKWEKGPPPGKRAKPKTKKAPEGLNDE